MKERSDQTVRGSLHRGRKGIVGGSYGRDAGRKGGGEASCLLCSGEMCLGA